MKTPGQVTHPLDPALTEQAALELALNALTFEVDPESSLLVLTEDAGGATATTFYAEALAVGPALANPAAFPWCLANAACGTIARRFGIIGPNVTWIVDDLDSQDAYLPVTSWLAETVTSAIIGAVRFSDPSPRISVWLWRPTDGPLSAEDFRTVWRASASFRNDGNTA